MPLSVPVLAAGLVTSLSYWGAAQRPMLVPDPLLAAVATGGCFLLLCLPLVLAKRDLASALSPEVMGACGYILYIGIAAFTNHTWPGQAVNPSVFSQLPLAIVAQTTGALCFFVGTVWGRGLGAQTRNRTTDPKRLALLIAGCAAITVYASLLTPRMSIIELRQRLVAGERVSWYYTAGQTIVLYCLPMIVAAWGHLKGSSRLVRGVLIASLGVSALMFFMSGSRSYAAQVLLMLLVSFLIVQGRINKKWFLAVGALVSLVLAASTWARLSGLLVAMSPGTFYTEELGVRVEAVAEGATNFGLEGMIRNIHENMVYHFSDNQTMAMMIRNSDIDPLWGRALFSSFVSALPSMLRPADHELASKLIVSHFAFYKQQPADTLYWPDWQISAGVMGFADFGIVGLLVYPFVAGALARWVYNTTVLSRGLGDAGWLVYVPVMHALWNPLLYGPDSTQNLRFLIPLALALKWTCHPLRATSAVRGRLTPRNTSGGGRDGS